MPIRWDTSLARHTARELDRALAGARLRAVRLDREARELSLLFRRRTLIWNLHPGRGYPRLHAEVAPAEGDHRYRGTLRSVEAPPDERLIRFGFSSSRAGPLSVVVELMSTQWNAVVTEGHEETIRHLLRRQRHDERRVIGQSYQPPHPTHRIGADGRLSLEDWKSVLGPLPDAERPRALLRNIAWTSPLNAGHLLPPAATGTTDLSLGFERWRALSDPESVAAPVLLELPGGLQPYPFPLADTPSRAVGSLMEAFEECARADGVWAEASPAAVLGPELLAGLERRVDQSARRVSSLEGELAELPDADRLRRVGDLILARYHEIPSGAVSAELTGFEGEQVEVRLDPTEPAHANAAAYYGQAARSERAAERLPGMLEGARAELARLERLLEGVRQGAADAEEVRAVVGPTTPAGRGEATGPSLPYRVFRSSGGLEIRVGRGARYNDDLTFRHSSPGDVWLHARHTAGAHVVLRWPGPGRPPARDLQEAATLAALHSKARTSGSVPVDWTLRKYVRKPRKSPPGQVVADRVETVFAEPDEAVMAALAERVGGDDASEDLQES